MKLILTAACAALLLTGCGAGGGDGTPVSATPPQQPPPMTTSPVAIPELPAQLPIHARNAPITPLTDQRVTVGAFVLPTVTVPQVVEHDAFAVHHGPSRDGVGANELIAYLSADAAQVRDRVLRWGDTPPVVRLVEGMHPDHVDQAVRAVQVINAALPHDWKLRFGAAVAAQDYANPASGAITIEFSPVTTWPSELPNLHDALGNSVIHFLSSGEITSAQIWVDPERDVTAGVIAEFGEEVDPKLVELTTLVHEIVHALGRQHADHRRFPSTIMHASALPEIGYYLYPLDREALLAVYGELEPGTPPAMLATELGPWADTAMHLYGRIEGVSFGAAVQNGLVQPWAIAFPPSTNLADNPMLSGSASWSGRLLGFTPTAAAVAGAADLTVQLSTLTGDLDFTGLESWAAGQAPGAVGTGAMWGDGNLNYRIGVRGNTFVRTGGDLGTVTGVFGGPEHQDMAGTLERTDLSAGFGGVRQ